MNSDFDPEALLHLLSRRKVDYILIGAFAAALHGSPLPTMDLDVCPARIDDNIARLADLLLSIRAHSGKPLERPSQAHSMRPANV